MRKRIIVLFLPLKKTSEFFRKTHRGGREINLVSWNLQPSKIDIREWDKDHIRMSRGITLTKEEGRLLMESLQKYFNDMAQEV